jgi:ribonucleoside-diphosphate reductase beta chain
MSLAFEPEALSSALRLNAEDKRLINADLVAVNQLMPLKYHWAWEHYLNGCRNHWLPQEVPVESRSGAVV